MMEEHKLSPRVETCLKADQINMIMSRRIIVRVVLVLIVLSSCTNRSDGKFSFQGSAGILDGLLALTDTKKHAYGQAFDEEAVALKYPNGTVTSFSISFFFAMVPERKQQGSHGMALVISPTKGVPGAFADQYLGIFNDTNNGDSSNHIVAVELDIHKDDEFGDINDNHVGININGLASVASAPAGYYGQDGNFRNLSLISGDLMRLTVVYSMEDELLNVTLSPGDMAVPPERPLLTWSGNLSPYMLDEMYFGFTASTGSIGTIHYMWIWYVYFMVTYPKLEFAYLPVLPPYPRKPSQTTRTILVVCLTLSVFVALLASGLVFFFYSRHKKVKEVLEEWEIEYGPYRFGYKELSKATKGFNANQLIGKGGFGKVYKGTLPGSYAEIAVKRVSHDSSQGMTEFLAEIATIGRLRHPSLVRLLGYCRRKAELYLVYDFMPNGSLDRFLYGNQDQEKLNWDQRFKIIKDVASALFYLHHEWVQVVIHRDIKPANVLIDQEMNARLGDFGLAKLCEQGLDHQTTTNVAGTFGYMAPDLVVTGRATTSTDVYAFGILMLEVTCGRRPIAQQAAAGEVFLVDLVLNCWENKDILDAVDEGLGEEQNREQLELVLKLGVLCSHQVVAARPSMTTVKGILDGTLQLPEKLLEIAKVGRYQLCSSNEELDLVTLQQSFTNLPFTTSFTSHGR